MTVCKLIELLSKQDPDKPVIVVVDWATDTAMSMGKTFRFRISETELQYGVT